MTELEHAIKHIKTRADAWAVKEVTDALQSISERLDKALSQEPCDDAISRDAVMGLVAREHTEWDDLYIDIAKLPSVTQKSKTGHWIETEYHRWRCSVCREKGMSEWDNIHDVRTNFCPDCGAKMESE